MNAAKTPPPPPLSSDDGMTAEDLALVITVPLVTFIFCCVLLYYRKKIADVCGGACCFWRRSRGRPSGSSARAAQYATRTPQPPSGGTRDEPATTPDSARWASSQPSAADPWTEPEPLSPFGAAPAGFSQQPFERASKTIDDARHVEDVSVSSDDSISSDDTDPFGAAPPATTPRRRPIHPSRIHRTTRTMIRTTIRLATRPPSSHRSAGRRTPSRTWTWVRRCPSGTPPTATTAPPTTRSARTRAAATTRSRTRSRTQTRRDHRRVRVDRRLVK